MASFTHSEPMSEIVIFISSLIQTDSPLRRCKINILNPPYDAWLEMVAEIYILPAVG